MLSIFLNDCKIYFLQNSQAFHLIIYLFHSIFLQIYDILEQLYHLLPYSMDKY